MQYFKVDSKLSFKVKIDQEGSSVANTKYICSKLKLEDADVYEITALPILAAFSSELTKRKMLS
jgi:hypothetical protein